MRFPLFALVAPVITALILWAVTGSPMSLLFGLLGPVMALAQYADSRRQNKKSSAEQEVKAHEDEQERLAREQTAAGEHRQEQLFKFPPASYWAQHTESLRPQWTTHYQGAVLAESDRVIRVGINATSGLPVLVDVNAGVALLGEEIETRSLQRALATQLSWRRGVEEYAVSGLNEPEVPHAGLGANSIIHLCASPADIPLGVRYVFDINNGKGQIRDLLGLSPVISPVQWDLLTRAEHNQIVECYRQNSVVHGTEELPERVVLSPGNPQECLDAREGFPVIVGKTISGSLLLDLVEHGPHALVVGRTGTGKTEFLKSWIMASATSYHPETLNFLILDYKGGTGLHQLTVLPHVTAVASDLDHEQSHRILSSLQAEIRHRERVLRFAEVADISVLPPETTLARLVIVVDEYRSLIEHEPELGKLFTDIASRGRSLGMHLILATQRFTGTIADSIAANAPLRICFKVSEPHESQLLLGDSSAAEMENIPGRAVVVTSQTAARQFQASMQSEAEFSQLLREISSHFQEVEIRPSWCEPLPALVDLSESPGVGHWLGMVDAPDRQTQYWLRIPTHPHAVFMISGPAASGKSAAARLIATQTSAELVGSAERLWDVVTLLDDSQSFVIDDLDALMEEYSLEHREAFLSAFVIWVRALRGAQQHLTVTLTSGSRYEMLWESLWQIRCTLESASNPGRARLDGNLIQLAFSATQQHPNPLAGDSLGENDLTDSFVVVSNRVSHWKSWVRAATKYVLADPSAELHVETPGAISVWVADTETWQERYRLFSQLKRTMPVLIDGLCAAEIRSLRVHPGLLPFVSLEKAILLDPETGPSRIDLNFLRRKLR